MHIVGKGDHCIEAETRTYPILSQVCIFVLKLFHINYLKVIHLTAKAYEL